MREVKKQTAAELGQTSVEAAPSNSYYTRCPARSLGSDFVVRVAQPLEEDRFNVKIEDIVQHFANLEELEISRISPHLMINLGETGFRASKSGRRKSRKVIVPQSLSKRPVSKETSDFHFITALCAISASGNVLRSGLIAKDRSTFLTPANVRSFGMSNDMSVPTLSPGAKFSTIIYEMSSRRISLIGANLLVPMPEHFLFLMVTGRICQKC
jgi:hypothetical protein